MIGCLLLRRLHNNSAAAAIVMLGEPTIAMSSQNVNPDVPPALAEALQPLLDRYGPDRLHQAMMTMAYPWRPAKRMPSPESTKKAGPDSTKSEESCLAFPKNYTRQVSMEDETDLSLFDLEMLRHVKCVGGESNVTFELRGYLSDDACSQPFVQTVDCYNTQRLLRLASNQILPPNQGRWKKLVLTDDSHCDLLEHPSMAMFENVEVNYAAVHVTDYQDEDYFDFAEVDWISKRMMFQLGNLARTGVFGFSFQLLGMDHDAAFTLKDMLQSNSVRELALHKIMFADEPEDGIFMLTDGIQACLSVNPDTLSTTQTFLETLDLRDLNEEDMCPLIHSLRGLPHLKTLRVTTEAMLEEQYDSFQEIMGVIEDSRCEIKDLYFHSQREEVMPDRSRIWKMLESSKSLRRIALYFSHQYWLNSDDMIQLLQSVMRQESILNLNLIGAVMPKLPELSHEASIMLPCNPRCCVRTISFRGWLFLGRPFDVITFFETCRTNIQSLKWLAEMYLPFLCNTMTDWEAEKEHLYKVSKNWEGLEQMIQELDDVRLLLDCNQAGRGLLRTPLPVPDGLWPLVLAKAVNSSSINFEKSSPPLNGLYSLIQGLYTGSGPLVWNESDQRSHYL